MKTSEPKSQYSHWATSQAKAFLARAHLYRLGMLPTEMQNPKSLQLSTWSQLDLPRALSVLREIDTEALQCLLENEHKLRSLQEEIWRILRSGGRIFLCGCGATGRLAMTLEVCWRQKFADRASFRNKVISFMAGGDVALVRSIEDFEDHPEYGRRHLDELGFKASDLAIGITEGGETPYVLGCVEHAVKIGNNNTWLVHCNPSDILRRHVARSERALSQTKVREISLVTGPMALSGSTRMQASTVLMAAVGLALLFEPQEQDLAEAIKQLLHLQSSISYDALEKFILAEAEVYSEGKTVTYSTASLGISVLTDTTERHPTFSIPPFENSLDLESPPSPCYLNIPSSRGASEAWEKILLRAPRALNWVEVTPLVTRERLLGFDFSDKGKELRRKRGKAPNESEFEIEWQSGQNGGRLVFNFRRVGKDDIKEFWDISPNSFLFVHLVCKMLINAHSTLVMGRLERYTGNVMTWVKPSNGKLIDRAIRYVQFLFRVNRQEAPPYERVALALFANIEKSTVDHSIVQSTYRDLNFSRSKDQS